MGFSLEDYDQFLDYVGPCYNITAEYAYRLWISSYQSDQLNAYSKPMPWIGIYIALASLVCIILMTVDFGDGLWDRKLWFPCKKFTLNAATLTVIAVAIKLPMDLTSLMPGYMDQAAKLGSLGFMCTMMANLLPSLAIMETKELVANIIALAVLVITLVVNVCIELNTGVLSYHVIDNFVAYIGNRLTAAIYVGMLLMLLVIYAANQKASKYEDLQQGGVTAEKLKQHVSQYWIMAETGSPQFMTACSAFSTVLHIVLMFSVWRNRRDYKSDYKWSTGVIFSAQFMGVIVGTIAPVSRCFAPLNFNLSGKRIWKHIRISEVESYWTQKLSDWKQSNLSFSSGSRKCKIIMEYLKSLILFVCIVFQKIVVVACKMIAVIPIFIVICVVYCFHCWRWLKSMFSTSVLVLGEKPMEQLEKVEDLSGYVLQLQDDIEYTERTLKGMLKSMNRLIQEAEKEQPNNLIKLLAQSGGFEGIDKFDSHHVQPLLSKENLNCWSLPLVTLTTIAMSLSNIQEDIVYCLLSGVSEGLVYVTLVEESLNSIHDHVSIQKAAKDLWLEVEVYHKWLGYNLQKPASRVNTAGQILQWLRDTAESIVIEVEKRDIGDRNDNSKYRSISANSMYRITETILLSYHANIEQLSQEELFVQLSLMIADILAACLTNLPQVIAMKCHTSAIEKRETSVNHAGQLLGETTQIINSLKDRELPSLNADELPFIDKWRDYFKNP